MKNQLYIIYIYNQYMKNKKNMFQITNQLPVISPTIVQAVGHEKGPCQNRRPRLAVAVGVFQGAAHDDIPGGSSTRYITFILNI